MIVAHSTGWSPAPAVCPQHTLTMQVRQLCYHPQAVAHASCQCVHPAFAFIDVNQSLFNNSCCEDQCKLVLCCCIGFVGGRFWG